MIDNQSPKPAFFLGPTMGKKQELQLQKKDKIYKDFSIEISKSDKLPEPKLGFFDKLRGKVLLQTHDGYVKVPSSIIKKHFNIDIREQKAAKNRDVTGLVSDRLQFEQVLEDAEKKIKEGVREINAELPKNAKSPFDSALKLLQLAFKLAEPNQNAQIVDQLALLSEKKYYPGMAEYGAHLVSDPSEEKQNQGIKLLIEVLEAKDASKESILTARKSLAKFYIREGKTPGKGEWYAKKVIEQGDMEGYYLLGEFEEKEHNLLIAREYYTKAAKAGVQEAQLQLNLFYREKSMVRKFSNQSEAVDYSRNLAQNLIQNISTQTGAWDKRTQENLSEAIRLLKEAQPKANEQQKKEIAEMALNIAQLYNDRYQKDVEDDVSKQIYLDKARDLRDLIQVDKERSIQVDKERSI